MKIKTFLCLSLFSSLFNSAEAKEKTNSLEWLNSYNPVWNTQSKNASESMPCGGGDIGMNVWVENDEVLFYLSRSGAFDENNLFPKFGRVRLSFTPNPFEGATFSQQLVLKDGYVTIMAEKNGKKSELKIWADVFSPVVSVEVNSAEPLALTATYESWRDQPLVWTEPGQVWASLAYRSAPMQATIYPDSVQLQNNQVLWYHKNREETLFDKTVEQQQLSSIQSTLWNPLKHLTFGGLMYGKDMVKDTQVSGKYMDTSFTGYRLKSTSKAKKHLVNVVLHIEQNEDTEVWKNNLTQIQKKHAQTSEAAKKKTVKWWNEFWNRSHVVINPDSAQQATTSWQVGRNYQLFRYQLACNAFGKLPTKFNGGLFTFDPSLVNETLPYTPDHRNWGGGTHTAQNQRLVYWPMLKNGDGEMLKPQLDFYKNALVNAEARVKKYWGHEGACFTEQIEWFGLPMAASYGWNRPAELDPGVQHNRWIDYEWDTVFEICKMALDWHYYSGADISEYLPLIEKSLIFFDEHYQYLATKRSSDKLTEKGKLVLYPGSACETYKVAYNASCTIGALKKVTELLLQLPESYLSGEKRAYFESFENRIPDIPIRIIDNQKTIAPALAWERVFNYEIPQLYPVFPWGIYGIGLPDLDVAINTWKYGIDNANQHGYVSWHQDAIFCARLGLTDEAKAVTLKKMTDSSKRFPTFWGPGHDWTPDHNWGGSGMIGVQEMLIQEAAGKIYLFPAWPKEWDVDFKMNLSRNTVVEGSLKEGKLVHLKVTPEERKSDVILNL
ncbi:MAG: DUF5703 domain-containing protein [Phocaeicola sp.]